MTEASYFTVRAMGNVTFSIEVTLTDASMRTFVLNIIRATGLNISRVPRLHVRLHGDAMELDIAHSLSATQRFIETTLFSKFIERNPSALSEIRRLASLPHNDDWSDSEKIALMDEDWSESHDR